MFNTSSVHCLQPHELGPDKVGAGLGGAGFGGAGFGGDVLGPFVTVQIPDLQMPKGTELHGVLSSLGIVLEHCPLVHWPGSSQSL